MLQFEYTIVANIQTDEERMSYLEQFTTDEANKIVLSFACMNAKYGYPAALKELEVRFGNSKFIANSFIEKGNELAISERQWIGA